MDQVKWAEAAHHSLRSRGIGRWSGGHGANVSDTLASRGGMEENKTAAGIICALLGEGRWREALFLGVKRDKVFVSKT